MIQITHEELQELIREREEHSYYFFNPVPDSLLEHKMNSNESGNFWYIGIDYWVDQFFRDNPNSKWKISGIYQFDYFYGVMKFHDKDQSYKCINRFFEQYYLFHFSKNNFKKVEVGFDYTMQNNRFKFNLNKIDFWEMHGIKEKPIPEFIKKGPPKSFGEVFPIFVGKPDISLETLNITFVPKNNFFNRYIKLIYRYEKEVVEFYDFPTDKEQYKPLCELVDFIDPYSLRYGDIFITGIYLDKTINKNSDENYYAPYLQIINSPEDECEVLKSYHDENAIIRCRDEHIRKYLCVYLYEKNSFIENLIKYDNFLCGNALGDIPVFIPEGDFEKYNLFFDKLTAARIEANKKYKLPDKKTKLESTEHLIKKYMDEFEKCINSKAYTAALIMAGSVLEAYLIDWLVEENGYSEGDSLDGCIEELQKKYGFANPPWNENSARFIQGKRNFVHPKRLLKNNEEISEKTCEDAYIYLNYIIDYRNQYGKKEANPVKDSSVCS